MYEEIAIRQQKIVDYTQKARYYKLKELPEHEAGIIVEDKAIVLCGNLLRAYSFARGLWRKRAEMVLDKIIRSESCEKGICIACEDRKFVITKAYSESEKEWYFTFDVTYNETNDALFKTQYYLEGAIADFTYVSFKWIMRNMNLLPYPFDKKWSDYLARGANNRIFYTCSGHLYFSQAYQETEFDRLSEVDRDDTELFHSFRLREPLKGEHTFRFYWFFGTGGEEHAGRISNILWELDESPIHTPQTDMEDMTDKLFELWKKSELCDIEQGDHYAAHYFSEFFGQFKNGYRPPDQFGCSWLEYDLLKANEFLRRWKETGNPEYRERTKRLINYYLYNHYVGNTKLTYPFHTGKFMTDIMPFCEKTGWGAPFEADAVDSLALPEMIDDAMVLYNQDKTLFQTDYPFDIIEDVLKLQQKDGHFRRLYHDDLTPKEKAGWVSQYSETQTWIPPLIKLYNATKDERLRTAYLKTAERCMLDIEELGLFSMGGCETDYPDLWDVDGYRTMLWAFLDLYEQEKDPIYLETAEKVQLFGNIMQMGYNVPPVPGTFYDQIKWKSKGMISTSYYPYPDYSRTQCTATGNQSVAWVAYLIMRLYKLTGKKIYAERAIATFRQVMLYRDEASLEGNPHKDQILYSIYENNPQMDDESGLYKKSYPENSYSLFIDLYLYLGKLLREFGGILIDTEKQHVFGLDCVNIVSCNWQTRELCAQNLLSREHTTSIHLNGKLLQKVTFPANGTVNIKF